MKGRPIWIRAAVLLAAAGFLPFAAPAHAFGGPEHTQVSNLGLWIAYQSECGPALSPGPACRAAEPLLACIDGVCKDPGEHLDLGAFTRAGDFFTGSSRIVSDPDGCRQGDTLTCREDLIAECEKEPAGCCEKVVAGSEERLRKRQRWFAAPWRLAATHRNKNHFREFARDQYNALHLRALQQARTGDFALALRTEGVALHFLQDLFAPGHLASARADFSDAASGSMHDYYNGHGIPFRVVSSPGWCDGLDRLELSLEGTGADGLRLPPSGARAVTIERKDLEDLRSALGSCGGTATGSYLDYRARGDGRLLDRKQITHDSRMHRLFLVLASAESIQQVLRAEADDEALQICFQFQSAQAQQTSKSSRLRTPDANIPYQAPGAVLTQLRFLPLDPDTSLCQPSLPGSLAGYLTDKSQSAEIHRLTDPFPRISVAEVAWSPIQWGNSGGGSPTSQRWELAWMLWGEVPESEVVERDQNDRLVQVEGEPLRFTQKSLERPLPLTWSLAVHHQAYEEFETWGSGLLIGFQGNLGSPLWNWYGIVEPGYALYQNDARKAWRWRAGARAGVGYGILFFEVAAERGFALDHTGDGYREWRYFAGPRLRFPTSWVSKVFRR